MGLILALPWDPALGREPSLAEARPTAAQAEQYLEWYAAGDHDRLWDAASDRYRSRTCLGDPARCPDLGRIPLGARQSSSWSCAGSRGTCTWTRTDRYDAPPLAYSEATEIDWIVTLDADGRFAGVAVDFREPGRGATAAAWILGLLVGAGFTFVLVWGALLGLLRAGDRPRGWA